MPKSNQNIRNIIREAIKMALEGVLKKEATEHQEFEMNASLGQKNAKEEPFQGTQEPESHPFRQAATFSDSNSGSWNQKTLIEKFISSRELDL